MNSKLINVTLISLFPLFSFAQWNTETSGVIWTEDHVGIGVASSSDVTKHLVVDGSIQFLGSRTLYIGSETEGGNPAVTQLRRYSDTFTFMKSSGTGYLAHKIGIGRAGDYLEESAVLTISQSANNTGGKVGIGTTNPSTALSFGGTNDVISVATDDGSDNGRISIVGGGALSINRGSYLVLHGNEFASDAGAVWLSAGNVTDSYIDFRAGGSKMRINRNGNVGIGTTQPDEKLTVKGKIHAEEIIVDTNVPAPDFVFEDNYNLPTLVQVEQHIQDHKHLPDVPSAKEMQENGVNMGEMQMKLLQKVEELTLYVIDLKKENEAMKEELRTIKNDK